MSAPGPSPATARASVPAPAGPASDAASTRKSLPFHGEVRGVNAASGALEVRNDEVPGWGMPQMTMTYHVSNPAVLTSVKVGGRVAADVYAGDFGKLYNVRAEAPASAAAPLPKNDLPPLSYVCPTAGEENEISDKVGPCEKSPAKLVPVRLTIAYECLKGPAFIQAMPGVCRYDKSELAPITASMFWTCDDAESTRYLEPGTCADGKPRETHFEKRPHGDHNPRHGGPYVAMSADLLHHAEGTFVSPGVFRAYFYDEYTRPMPVAGYTASLAPTDSNAKENGPAIPLHGAPSLGPNVLEARVGGAATPSKDAAVHFKLHVAVKPGAKDWTSDWDFLRYSIEPGITATAPTTTVAKAAPAVPPAIPAAPASPTASATPATSASAPASTAIGGGAEISPAGAPPQEPVPATTAGLIQELQQRTGSVADQLNQGNLAGLWLDALRAKDLAIALEEQHGKDVAPAARGDLADATKTLTETAWQIDAAGDLGQAEQILELQKTFADSTARIESLYGTTPR
jgi:Cu/Ag efflux protein CusF